MNVLGGQAPGRVWGSPTMEDCTMPCTSCQCLQDMHVGENPFYNYLSLEPNCIQTHNYFCMVLKYTEFSRNTNYHHVN